jgi:hypothetical protein
MLPHLMALFPFLKRIIQDIKKTCLAMCYNQNTKLITLFTYNAKTGTLSFHLISQNGIQKH